MINVCAGWPQEQAALYDAQDSDDPKAAIVELILQVRITHSRRPNAVLTRMNVHRMLRAPTRRRHSARSCRRCGWAACASGRRRRAWGTTNCAMLRCEATTTVQQLLSRLCTVSEQGLWSGRGGSEGGGHRADSEGRPRRLTLTFHAGWRWWMMAGAGWRRWMMDDASDTRTDRRD